MTIQLLPIRQDFVTWWWKILFQQRAFGRKQRPAIPGQPGTVRPRIVDILASGVLRGGEGKRSSCIQRSRGLRAQLRPLDSRLPITSTAISQALTIDVLHYPGQDAGPTLLSEWFSSLV